MSLNTCIFMGRLTAAPEVKKTNSDVSYAKFTVAVERNYKQGDTKIADFIPMVAWRGTADFIGKFFRKGDMIAVDGSLQSEKYTDKDGNNRTAFSVQVNNVAFCGGKNEAKPKENETDSVDTDDEYPFG